MNFSAFLPNLRLTVFFRTILGLYLCLALTSCGSSEPRYYPQGRLLKVGDDPSWSATDLDDSDWIENGSVAGYGVFWLRFHCNWSAAELERIEHKGIGMISIGAYEAYWDGELVATEGKVGQDKATEIPGRFISEFLLSDSLATAGHHVLALRVSRFHGAAFSSWNNFYLSEYFSLGRLGLKVSLAMAVLGGIFLSAGFYYLLLFYRSRDLAGFIFGLMCLLFFALLFMEYFKFFYAYLYPFHYTRLLIIGTITLALSVLTPWFFLTYYNIQHRNKWLLAYCLFVAVYLVTFSLNFDSTIQQLGIFAWTTTLLITTYAWWKGRPESHIMLGVLLLFYVLPSLVEHAEIFLFTFDYDISLFLSFALLVFTQLYLLAKRNQAQQLAYEETLLRSTRLQNELLRKNIQPHFLLNTLTSLIDWVEESPKESVDFIEALAEEFAAFHAIAAETSIALPKSLHLCKSHLKVMRYRKEIDYQWTEENLDYTQDIPPGILLTLVENGVTHGKSDEKGAMRFHLQHTLLPEHRQRRYTLTVFASIRSKNYGLGTGTGLNYVRSRLDESYGDQWTMESGAVENGWATSINIPE